MRYALPCLLLLVFFAAPLQAAELSTEREARQLSDALVEHFMREEFERGFDRAKQYWPLPAVEIDGLVNQVEQQWPIVRRRFGAAVGTEFVREETIGKSFLRHYYLHKFKNHAIYWRFDYYKPEGGWKINSILFLDTLDDLYR